MTANTTPVLDDLERDALTALVNLGVSRAAVSLRGMVGSEVLLAVPSVELMPYAQAVRQFGERVADELVAVYQSFEGEMSGGALLIFPATNSLELVRAITGGGLPLEEIIALEQEALAETGNIILNGCLATIANRLNRTLRVSLPEIVHGTGGEVFRRSTIVAADMTVLFLYIDFTVRDHDVHGNIAMLMDMPSLLTLKSLLSNLLERVSDGPDSDYVAH